MAKIILESNFKKKELVESLDRVLFNHILRCMELNQSDDKDVNDTLIIKDLLLNLTKVKGGRIMEYKYDFTELNDMLNFHSPQEIAAKLDRMAVFMTRCCLSLSDDERHMFLSDLSKHIEFLDGLSYDLRNITPVK